MYHSASRGMRRRRRKSIFSGLTFSAASARTSPTLRRFCTGFLLLSSVVLCHVTLVRYVDERLRPEVASSDVSSSERFQLPVVDVDGRNGAGGSSRRLMSKDENNEVLGLEDRRTELHPKKNDVAPSRSGQIPVCLDRPIQGLNAVCSHLPCLRALQVARGGSTSPGSSQIPSDVLRRLNRIPGSLDPVHYTLFPFLSDMQRSKGIVGSVGQLGGVHLGQLTALLSLNVDRMSRERLFVSDRFNSTSTSEELQLLPGLSQFDIFRSHLRDFHFDVHSPTSPEEDRLYVHHDTPSSSENLPDLLHAWNLPRFRLISVEASGSDLDAVVEGLELAACLLRDGGIIVVDQPTSIEAALTRVSRFIARHGTSAISPIFSAGNKLFLTTTNWKKVYEDHFRRKETGLLHLTVANDDHRSDGYHGDKIFVVR